VRVPDSPAGPPEAAADVAGDFKLSRWLVEFASGGTWYGVGEFVAADAASAIGRAVAVFGEASAYRAEEVPWDAAPLWRSGGWPKESRRGP
jgi:hypothetical protein